MPTALAQVPQPGLTVTLDAPSPSLELGAANSTSFNGTVTYADTAPTVPGAGSTDGQITLSITVPEGWTATLEPSSTFTLAPGASAPFTVSLTAPAAGVGAANGSLDVGATSTSAGGRTATATAGIALTRLDPAIIVIPWFKTLGGILAIIGTILVVVAAIAYFFYRRNARIVAAKAAAEAAAKAAYLDRETGILVSLASEPRQYGHKREILFRIRVKNASERRRNVIVDVAEVTNGWRAAFQFNKLILEAGATQEVTLVVTPDVVITPGDRAKVTVRAKPAEAIELSERVTLDVLAPKHGVPADPHYRIVTVHREGANTGGVKR